MPLETIAPSESKAIELLKKRLSGFETEEGRLKGLNFKPRPDDIFIVATPKAGTTWVQQICHQLRTGVIWDLRKSPKLSRGLSWHMIKDRTSKPSKLLIPVASRHTAGMTTVLKGQST